VKETAKRSASSSSHLAHANGYYIAWENVSQPDMPAAAIESFNGETHKLAAIIRENLIER
jgi:hypothetical protein